MEGFDLASIGMSDVTDDDERYCYCGHSAGSHNAAWDSPYCYGCEDAEADDELSELHTFEECNA